MFANFNKLFGFASTAHLKGKYYVGGKIMSYIVNEYLSDKNKRDIITKSLHPMRISEAIIIMISAYTKIEYYDYILSHLKDVEKYIDEIFKDIQKCHH